MSGAGRAAENEASWRAPSGEGQAPRAPRLRAPKLARRVGGIAPFRVVQILERARELERTGRDIVHFEVGEPDFPTAPTVVAAGIEALSTGRTGYTQALGLPALRAAIARRYGVEADRVAVTTGASGALNLLAQVLIDPGDEVLVADPGYPCNDVFIQAAGGVARRVPVSASTRFQLDREALEDAWTPRTAGVLLGSPANPTGSVLRRADLEAMRDFVGDRGFVIVDEIYNGLVYDAQDDPAGADLLLESALTVDDGIFVVNSFSKYFGMTGWRLGWLVAPGSCRRGAGPSRSPAEGSFLRGAGPSRSPAEGSFLRGAGPSRSPAEGSFLRGAGPSRSPAEGSFLRGAGPSRSPAEGSVMDAIERAAQNLYIAPPSVAQYAALAALEAPALAVHEERRRIFSRRREVLLDGLARLGLPVAQRPTGAFYAYANIQATGFDSESFCERLIEDFGVAVTPGTDFGAFRAAEHVRFAYTVDERDIAEGIERIGEALRRLG